MSEAIKRALITGGSGRIGAAEAVTFDVTDAAATLVTLDCLYNWPRRTPPRC